MSDASLPESALPSVGARVAAFAAILVGGLAGGVIGEAYARLQCDDGACTVSRGLWLWAGSTVGAAGIAVIAVLTLRAFGEWSSVSAQASRRRR